MITATGTDTPKVKLLLYPDRKGRARRSRSDANPGRALGRGASRGRAEWAPCCENSPDAACCELEGEDCDCL